MLVSELEGQTLDRWVLHASGLPVGAKIRGFPMPYSTDWAHGGPLIDSFNVDVCREYDGTFHACIDGPASVPESDVTARGPTRLVAAMRCIVASVYYDSVPDQVVA